MELDQIKVEFVREMSQLNTMLAINPRLFAILCVLLMERHQLSQERIQHLTGISTGGISQLIRDLSTFFPIKKVKIPGDRKKYYRFEITTELFMVTLYEKLGENLIQNIDALTTLTADITPLTSTHERFAHLSRVCTDYLADIRANVAVFHQVHDEFHTLYNSSSEILVHWIDENELELALKSSPISIPLPSPDFQRNLHADMPEMMYRNVYLPLKERLYQIMVQTVGTSLVNPKTVALGRITLELMLEEQFLSKHDLEQATQYKPTIISNVLRHSVKRQVVDVWEPEDGRKKYYRAKSSLIGSPQRKLIVSNQFVQTAITTLKKYRDRVIAKQKSDGQFVEFLEQFEKAYVLYRQYTSKIQLEILRKTNRMP